MLAVRVHRSGCLYARAYLRLSPDACAVPLANTCLVISFRITAYGAAGGKGAKNHNKRNHGVFISAIFPLEKGDLLYILVGHQGEDACPGVSRCTHLFIVLFPSWILPCSGVTRQGNFNCCIQGGKKTNKSVSVAASVLLRIWVISHNVVNALALQRNPQTRKICLGESSVIEDNAGGESGAEWAGGGGGGGGATYIFKVKKNIWNIFVFVFSDIQFICSSIQCAVKRVLLSLQMEEGELIPLLIAAGGGGNAYMEDPESTQDLVPLEQYENSTAAPSASGQTGAAGKTQSVFARKTCALQFGAVSKP